MPALPLDEAGKYVAAAYLVFLALILIYVAIMATRLSHLQRDIEELEEMSQGDISFNAKTSSSREVAET